MNIHELNYALDWLEKHPADLDKSAYELVDEVKVPIDFATWTKAKKFIRDDQGLQKPAAAGDKTSIEVNVKVRTATVNYNGVMRTFNLKAIDPLALVTVYRKRGYKDTWLTDNVVLLVKNIRSNAKGYKQNEAA